MTTNTSIHRLLDEAFAGVAPTPASQDLKEELRANLSARADELEASGMPAGDAARKAFDELGDVSALVADASADARPDWARNRVRRRAGFVVRATLLPIAATAALVVGVLVACGLIPGGSALAAGLLAVVGVLIGVVTADALAQETTAHYAMPLPRAIGYGVGDALLLAGLGGIGAAWTTGPLWLWIVAGGVLALAGIGVLAGFGATQTNRTKPWALGHSAEYLQGRPEVGNRFEQDPNAAARFGIYTMLIWVVGTVAAVLLGVFVGWWWSALPWIGAFIAMMLLLTQMLFKPEKSSANEVLRSIRS